VIREVGASAFRAFLQFLYTGDCTDSAKNEYSQELLRLADMYDVPRLKAQCCYVLQQRISLTSVSSILGLADMYHGADLQECCINFIVRHFADVIVTDDFKELTHSNPRIVGEIHLAYSRSVVAKRSMPEVQGRPVKKVRVM